MWRMTMNEQSTNNGLKKQKYVVVFRSPTKQIYKNLTFKA